MAKVADLAWPLRGRVSYTERHGNGQKTGGATGLLELNARRAAEEARSGKAATAAPRKTERPSAWTTERRAGAARAAEPRPLWGTSDD